MADEGLTSVVENDPVATAFAGDELGQSVDPLLDPEGQSVDPAPADPGAVDLEEPLAEIGKRARALTGDPVPLLVAQIHEEIQQLLRLHRDIGDGIELATEQVQDKRIDFLEAGPEVTVSGLFVEVLLGFLLESPLMAAAVKEVLQQGYRFVGNVASRRRLVSRAGKLERLRAAAETFRAPRLGVPAAQRGRFQELQMLELDARLRIHETSSPEIRKQLETQVATLRRMMKELSQQPVDDGLDAAKKIAAQRPKIDAKDLQQYFVELDSLASDHGVLVAKQAATLAQKAVPAIVQEPPAATDSIGVQIKSLSQFHLRNLEMYLGLAAADADLLRGIAQADPFLAPDCIALLAEMLGLLQRAAPSGGRKQDQLDARHVVMIEVEKLIWALLVPNAPSLTPAEIQDIRKNARQVGDLGANAAVGGQVAQQENQRPAPSRRVMQYWQARFFEGRNLNNEQAAAEMRALRNAFLQKGERERLITIISVPFKPDP